MKSLNPKRAMSTRSLPTCFALQIEHAPEPATEILPFFSKVMLRQARRALETMKYKVSLCKVKNIFKSTPSTEEPRAEVPV